MEKRLFLLVLPVFAFACHNKANDSETQKKILNDQSLQCIAVMNSAEVSKDAAMQSGDAATAEKFQATIDSAAKENALIGQKLMELEK